MNVDPARSTDPTHVFRPAKRRRPQRWSLQHDRLVGPGGSVALRKVRHVSLLQLRSGTARLMQFDLETGSQVARLQLATSARRERGDPDQAAYLALLSAVAHRLEQLNPGLTFRMEDTGRAHMALFMIGAAALLTALALTAVLGVAYLDQPRRFLLLLPALLLLMLGGALCACRFWPFRRPEEYPIQSLPMVLWSLGGPRAGPTEAPDPGP